jgi:integrase
VRKVERNLWQHENGTYYYVARVDGALTRLSLKTDKLPEARKRVRDLVLNALQGRTLGRISQEQPPVRVVKAPAIAQGEPENPLSIQQDERPSVREALVLHRRTLVLKTKSTREMADRGERVINTYCQSWDDFEPVDIWNKYRVSRMETLGRELTSACNHLLWYLRKFVPWAVENGWLPPKAQKSVDSLEKLKVNPRRIRVPSAEEVDVLLRMVGTEDPDGEDFLRFLATTGVRISGALKLRWPKIDLKAGKMWVWQKQGAEKEILITPEALAILAKRRDKKEGPFAHLDQNGLERLERKLKRFAKGLEIDLQYFHAFRHYFASHALMARMTPQEVAKLLGHSDGGQLVLQTYGHIYDEHLKSAVARLRLASTDGE